MPRISDTFLHCTLYLYPSRPAAEGGVPLGGSGFLVSVPRGDKKLAPAHPQVRFDTAGETHSSFHHLYIATNRHVADDNFYARLTRKDGRSVTVEISDWSRHKTSDLAVAEIKWTQAWEHDYNFTVIPHQIFLSEPHLRVLNIGPGDDTFCVGRFIAHDGRERNLPIVRFGNIAMLPHEQVEIEGVGSQNCFLVESRIIPGYSGSPVFLSIPPWELRESGDNSYRSLIADDLETRSPEINQYYIRLLGITTALFSSDLAEKNVNTGMMAVIPAWELLELLNSDTLNEQRRTEHERRREWLSD